MPLFIFWIIFLLDLELNFIGKLLVFRWELIVLLLLQICFFFVMRELTLFKAFHSTSRYLDDELNIDNIYFDQIVDRIQNSNLIEQIFPIPRHLFWIWIYVYLMVQVPPKFMINGTIFILM